MMAFRGGHGNSWVKLPGIQEADVWQRAHWMLREIKGGFMWRRVGLGGGPAGWNVSLYDARGTWIAYWNAWSREEVCVLAAATPNKPWA